MQIKKEDSDKFGGNPIPEVRYASLLKQPPTPPFFSQWISITVHYSFLSVLHYSFIIPWIKELEQFILAKIAKKRHNEDQNLLWINSKKNKKKKKKNSEKTSTDALSIL